MKHATRILLVATLSLVAGAARAQVELKPKALDGTVHQQHTLNLKQTFKIGGMDIPTAVDMEIGTTMTGAAPEADGTRRITNKTDKMVVKIAAPGVDINFDSAHPEAAKADDNTLKGAVQAWKAISGATYTVVLGAKGEVKAVEGADKIIQAGGQDAADQLKKELSLAKLQRDAAQELGALPDKAVKKGDRWERSEIEEIGGGQTFTMQTFYEYAGPVERNGKTLEKVNIFIGDVKYAQDPNVPAPAHVTKSDLKVATSLGSYLFDPESGMVVERTGNIRITGSMTLDVNGMEIPADIDLTMDTSTTVKR